MAKKYDNSKYQSLKSQKSANEKKQESYKSEINDIEAEIERLRVAYNTLDDAKEALEDIKNIHSNMPTFYESLWTGNKAQYFYEICESGGLKIDYDGYISGIDSVEDEINGEINALKEKQNEKYGALSNLVHAWDDLCTKIRNFFN